MINKNDNILSIIIPVFNAEKFIKKTLVKSLKYFTDCEVILVNDGSSDNTLKILNEIAADKKNIKIIDKKNGGVSSARNCGIENATGEYIYFMDCDDQVTEKFLDVKNVLYNERPDILKFNFLSQRRIKFFYHKNICLENYNSGFIYKNPIYLKMLTTTNFNSVCSQIIKKSIIDKIRFDESLVMAEDFDFNLKIYTFAKRIYYMPIFAFIYNCNGSSVTRKSSVEKDLKMLKDIIFVYSKLYEYNKIWNVNIEEIKISQHIDTITSYIINKKRSYDDKIYLINEYKKILNNKVQ